MLQYVIMQIGNLLEKKARINCKLACLNGIAKETDLIMLRYLKNVAHYHSCINRNPNYSRKYSHLESNERTL